MLRDAQRLPGRVPPLRVAWRGHVEGARTCMAYRVLTSDLGCSCALSNGSSSSSCATTS